ncbi:MAG: hydroxyacylglutathione hydrolase [Verrucomicrobiales bacterium]|jgi:hydroxyacylglutathione hydrolase
MAAAELRECINSTPSIPRNTTNSSILMALIFETIQTEGIAELSYLIGDSSTGTAAVIDPTPDVGKYVDLARDHGLSITHVFETHIHADLVSGARELSDRTQSAKIYVSKEGDASYQFEHEDIRDGDEFAFGDTLLTVRHTPGHTPEHVAYVITSKEHPDTPWGVLTGDSLFVSSAGRPDLLGSDNTDELTEKLFHTLRDFYLELPDSVMIFPAHGHGSPCGADIGDRLQSTIGYKRKYNSYLQISDLDEFKEHALSGAPPVPTYYPRMKEVNAAGPEVLGHLPRVRALTPEEFDERVASGDCALVDTRSMLAFGGGHIAGAFSIGGSPMLSIWAGWLIDPDQPILLVLDDDSEVDEIVKIFLRTGYSKFAGYLAGGMTKKIKTFGTEFHLQEFAVPPATLQKHLPHARTLVRSAADDQNVPVFHFYTARRVEADPDWVPPILEAQKEPLLAGGLQSMIHHLDSATIPYRIRRNLPAELLITDTPQRSLRPYRIRSGLVQD